jgi:uncharacterized protein YprB with RNaseH-like and TPR domain
LITCSFRHIAGIGPMRERQLWQSGIRSWDDVPPGDVLSPRLDDKLREGVARSREALARGDLDFFARSLAQTEHWRLLPQLLPDAGFLDIEAADERVTVIGVLDAQGIRSFVGSDGCCGERELAAFRERAARWKCVVTFNGAVFDLPVLRRVLPGWLPPLAHVDLKQVFQRLHEKGGLKALEPRVGFERPPHLARLTGSDAVALWRAQRDGDPSALRRLVEYNLYDVFILKPLAELGYNRLLKRTGMPAPELPVSDRGAMLYDVSRAALDALR